MVSELNASRYGATDCPNADGIPKDSIIILLQS